MSYEPKFHTLNPSVSGSGGGAPEEAHTPVEQPNTLQSVVKGRIIDLIGYGPIKGLVNGLQSIYLDDTPLQNADGTFNFEGMTVDTREGYPTQPYMAGFPAIENSIEIGTEVLFENPPIRSITNNDADVAIITVQFSSLVMTEENGDAVGTSVTVMIDYRSDGGAWINSVSHEVSGKTTSPYPISFRVELDGDGPFDIRVRRGNKESEESKLQDKLTWTLINEVIEQKMMYPNMALVGLSIDSKLFGATMPSRSYDMYMSVVKVPSNYNPETREYTGIWDGSFKDGWTDNPAWCFYDLAMHPIIGGGLNDTDKWLIYKIGQYCDQLVPDGYGGMEPRFTCNTVFSAQEDATTALNTFASCFRGMAYWGSNVMVPVADMPGPIRKIVGPANVVDGDFERSSTSIRERHSVCVVMWNDPNDNFKAVPEVYEDPDSIVEFGWVETRVTAVACSSRGQAHRLAKWILYSERMETQTLKYQAAPDHADLRPGEYIQVGDPHEQGARMVGRIIEPGLNSLVVDQLPDQAVIDMARSWFISVLEPDGSIFRSEVSTFNRATNTVNLLNAMPTLPEPGFMWALSSVSLELPQYRVVSVAEAGDMFSITATEHDPRKYDIVEFDLQLPDRPISTLPTGAVAPPLDLSFQVYKYQAGGSEHQGLLISWTPAKDVRVDSYVLDVMDPSASSFRTVYNGPGLSFDLKDAQGGQWTIRVRSIASGIPSQWVTRTVQVTVMLLPVPPDSVDVKEGTFDITLNPRSAYQGQLYEFWRSLVALELNTIEGSATQLPTGTYLVDTKLKPMTTYFYFIRGVNNYGKSTWYSLQAQTEQNFDDIISAIGDSIKEGALYQDLISIIPDLNEDAINAAVAPILEQVEANRTLINDSVASVRSDVGQALATVQQTVTNLNTAVGNVQTQVGGLHTTVGTLRTDLDSSVSALNSSLTTVKGDIGKINTDLVAIRTDIGKIVDALDYVPTKAYAKDDAVRSGQRLFVAIAAVPAAANGANKPPNATYWKDVGQIATDGASTASALQLLTTRVTNAEGVNTSQATAITNLNTAVGNKADASALTSLTTRVTSAEGTLTSQGNSITSLTNSLTGKADASALQALTTRVTSAEGTITSQGNSITSLTNSLAGKADSSALTSLSSTVTSQGQTLTSQGQALTNVTASLGNLGATGVNMLPAEYCVFGSTLPTMYRNGVTAEVVADPLTARGYALKITNPTTTSGSFALAETLTAVNANMSFKKGKYIVSYWAKSDTAGQQIGAYMRVLRADGVAFTTGPVTLLTLTTSWVRYSVVMDLTGATYDGTQCQLALQPNRSQVAGSVVYYDRIMVESAVNSASEPSVFVLGNSYDQSVSNAAATTGLTARMTSAEGTITGQATQITNLTTTVGNKADASAVTNLATRVTAAEGVNTSQGTSITNLNNSVNSPTSGLNTKASTTALNSLTTRVEATETGLLAASQDITSLNSNLTDAGGENLLFNPSFDKSSVAPLNVADGWLVGSGGVPSLVTSTLDSRGKAQRIDISTPMDAAGLVDIIPVTENLPPAVPGQIVTISVFVRGTPGLAIQMYIQARNASNSSISTTTGGYVTLTSEWQRVTLTNTVPFPAATVKFQTYYRLRAGTVSTGFAELDQAQAQIGKVATGWKDNTGTLQVDQAATASALTALTTLVSNQGGQLTSQSASITSLTNSLSDIGSQNLAYNPSFERSSTGGNADGWWTSAAGGATRTASLVPSTLEGGGQSQRIDVAALNTSSAYIQLYMLTPKIPGSSPGQVISASCFVKGTATLRIQIFIEFWDDSALLLRTPSSAVVANGAWQRVSYAGAVAPAGTTRVQMLMRILATGSTVAGYVEFDRAQLEGGAVVSGWADNNSLNPGGGKGTNLIPVEYTMFGAVAPQVVSASGVNVSTIADPSGFGPFNLRADVTTASNGWVYLASGSTAYNLQLKPGGRYIFSCWIRGSAAHDVAVRLRYTNSANTVVEVGLGSVTAGTVTTRVSCPIVIPDAVVEKALIVLYTQVPSSTGTTIFDGFMLEEQTGASDAPSPFTAGSAGSAVLANSSAISALNSSVTSINGLITSQASDITALKNSVGSGDFIAAQSWEFLGDTRNWVANAADVTLVAGPAFATATGFTTLQAASNTFGFVSGVENPYVRIRMRRRNTTRTVGAFYWANEDGGFAEARRANINIDISSTDWQEIEIDLSGIASWSTKTKVYSLRVDPMSSGDTSGSVDIAYVAIGRRAAAASAQALDTLSSTVTAQGSSLTSVTSRTTLLENAVNDSTTGLAKKASAAALTDLTNRVSTAEGTITSQSTAITSLNATVVGIGPSGVNMLPAEFTVFNDKIPAMYRNSGITLSTVADVDTFRGYALRAQSSNTSTGETFVLSPTLNAAGCNMSFKNGKYIVSYWAKASVAGHQVASYFRMLQQDGSFATGPATPVTLTTSWARYSVVMDLNSAVINGTQCQLAIQPNRSGVSGRVAFFDRIMVEAVTNNATAPSNFILGNSFDQVTSTASALSSLDARVVATEDGVTANGKAITNLNLAVSKKADSTVTTALTNTVSDLNDVVTTQGQALTTINNNLGNAGGQNLLYNPSFDKLAESGTRPDGWVAIAPSGPTWSTYSIASTLDPAGRAQRVEASGLTTATYVDLTLDSDKRPAVSAGQVITMSIYLRGTPGLGFQMFMQTRNSQGTLVNQASLGVTLVTNDWQRVTLTSTVLPSGSFNTAPLIRLRPDAGGTVTAGLIDYDRVQIQVGSIATGWQDNNLTLAVDTAANATATSLLTGRVSQAEGNITSQSSSITSLNNSLSMSGGDNLLANSSFEDKANASRPTHWNISSGGVGSFVTSPLTLSSLALRVTRAAAPAGSTVDVSSTTADGFARPFVTAGASYTLSAMVRAIAGNYRIIMYIQFVNSAGSVIATATSPQMAVTTTFSRLSLTGVAPAGSVSAIAYPARLVNNTGAAADMWFEVDNVQLQEGDVATAYKPSTKALTDAQSAAIDSLNSSVTTINGNITSVTSRTTALENSVNSASSGLATKASSSALTDLTSRVTTAEGTISSQSSSITDLKNAVGGAIDPAPDASWNFDGSVEGWTSAGGTLAVSGGALRITANSADPQIIRGGLAIVGSQAGLIRAQITRLAGAATDWDGIAFYATANHGHGTGYYKRASNPSIAVGQTAVVDWDMTTLTAGGNDWINNTITGIRLDLGATSGGAFAVDWIVVGRLGPSASSRAFSILSSTVDQQGKDLTAQSQLITGLTTTVGGNTSAITDETTARTNADSALSSRITTAQSTANGATTTAQTALTTAQNTNGTLTASYTVKFQTTQNGIRYAAGFGANLLSTSSGVQSNFYVLADTFAVLNNTSNGASLFTPFVVTNGQVFIADAVIRDASITSAKIGNAQIGSVHIQDGSINNAKIGDAQISTAKIGDAQVDTLRIRGNSVTVPSFATRSDEMTALSWVTVLDLYIALDVPGWLFGSSTGYIAYGGGFGATDSQLVIAGQVVSVGGGDSSWINATHSGAVYVPAGTHRIELQFRSPSGAGRIISRSLFGMAVKR